MGRNLFQYAPLFWACLGDIHFREGAQMPIKTTFKSPLRKLVRFFERSRDRWKAKCLESRATVKRLKKKTAQLSAGRDRWKAIARQREQELSQLKRELEEQKVRLG
jgi:hypothetical protein